MRKRLIIIFFALAVFAVIWLKPFYVAPILMYHSINPEVQSDTPTVSPKAFERQMEYIHRKGYRVITLSEYVKARLKGRPLKNVVILTLDDGYKDNYTYAFPVLKKYGLPATIFIIVKHFEDNPRFLKIPQIEEMAKGGIEFGSHTVSHERLTDIKEAGELSKQVLGSKQILEQKLGMRMDILCYPFGYYDDNVKELTKEAGYLAAVTTTKGPGKLNKDLYAIKRIKISEKDVPSFVLWLKLSGYYWIFQKNRNSY